MARYCCACLRVLNNCHLLNVYCLCLIPLKYVYISLGTCVNICLLDTCFLCKHFVLTGTLATHHQCVGYLMPHVVKFSLSYNLCNTTKLLFDSLRLFLICWSLYACLVHSLK